MDISNHRIDDIWYRQTSNLSPGTITPTFIVTHYTTGWNGTSSRDWLLGSAGGTANTRTSAHLVIDEDGTAWQLAPFNRRAWHAGPSRHGALSDLNSHAVGIEFINAGWMKPMAGGGRWIDDNGVIKTEGQLNARGGFIEAQHPRVGSQTYAWPLYTESQLRIGRQIVLALINKYDIKGILTHEEIDTRGWKTDPGPAFPQQSFVELIDGGSDAPGAPSRFIVNATRLNVRGGPSAAAERMDPPGSIPKDTSVEITRRSGGWAYITVVAAPPTAAGTVPVGLQGWVDASYLLPAT
ncbi:MAG: N-acetylmuramoyl-L-alanine amidase [Gemmobacter sp.]